jgi:hypothetical protein
MLTKKGAALKYIVNMPTNSAANNASLEVFISANNNAIKNNQF